MKKQLHNIIKKLGYVLLKRKYMPAGVALERDIEENTSLDAIKTVFDVGANIGNMALYFHDVFPQAKILAFEPVSSTLAVLKKNVGKFKDITTYQVGFSDQPGSVKLFLQADHGLNSMNDAVNKPDEKQGGKFETIHLDTVDIFCQKNKIDSIDLLKTDAEGLDLKIMQGAAQMLKEGRIKYILSEVGFSEDNQRNTPFEDLRVYLASHGYKLRGFYDQSNFGNLTYMTCANALFMLQPRVKGQILN